MKLNEPISTIMTTKVRTIALDKSLHEAKSKMIRGKIRHLPVVLGTKLIGILSLTDVLRLGFAQVYIGQEDADQAMMDMLNIEQVMRSHPKTVSPNQTIKEVAEIFSHEEFHALPIVDGEDLVGIITTTDIIRHLLKITA